MHQVRLLEQVVVRAPLDDLAILQNQDLVCVSHRTQPMRDHNPGRGQVVLVASARAIDNR
jgi:hypothetical protein